jgi:AcrR family transcriptional regulator
MPRNVKPPRRPYDSPRRRAQAAATRLAILEAAEPLFEQHGYVGTSVAEIADAAGVALKTVYAVFGTKAEVLRALWNLRIRGDDEPAPLAERQWYRDLLAEPDARRRLGLVARNARVIRERTGALPEIVRLAAPAEKEIAALWGRFQRDLYDVGSRGIAESLERDGALAVDVETATDLLWTFLHPDLHQLLVRQRGWAPERYEEWLADTLRRQLLKRRRELRSS